MLEIFDLLFPTLCTGCREYGILLCHTCLNSISAPLQSCIGCGEINIRGKTCAECLLQKPLLPEQLLCAANYHQELVSKIIATLKYVGVKDLAQTCAQVMANQINRIFPASELFAIKQNFVITYVPMHKNKQVSRGFNQAQLITARLAAILDMPIADALQKVRKTKAQMGLNRSDRLTNVQGAFAALDSSAKNFILVDDVTTTGSTMLECAGELKKSGATKVYCLAFAKD